MKKLIIFTVLLAFYLSFGFSKAQAYAAADYYNAGLQLYNAQNYAQAAQYFSAAVQMDPTNMAALQGRANCYYTLGRYSDALADYQKVQSVMPSPALDQLIQSIQAKVAAAPPAAGGAETPALFKVSNTGASHGVVRPRSYRVSPYIALFNLSDFVGNSQYMASLGAYFQSAYDPNITESGSVPTVGPGVNFEVENPILPDFNVSAEIGLTAGGTAQDNIQDANINYSWTDSFNILLGHFGVLGRLYLADNDLQPWVAAGPIIDFGSVESNYNINNGSTYSYSFTGPSTGLGFGGQAQLGMDYKISDNISLGAFVGYQLASISNFKNTITNSNIPNVASGSTAVLSVVPTSRGNAIVPVDNGVLCAPTVDQNPGDAAPAGTRPVSIDDSGIFGGLSVAFHL